MIAIILIYASIFDIKYRRIQDFIPVAVIIYTFYSGNFSAQKLIHSLAFIVLSLITVVLAEHFLNIFLIGGGDLKFIASFIFAIGIYDTLTILILMLIPLFIVKISKYNTKYIPLAPYFSIGYFLFKLIGGIYV